MSTSDGSTLKTALAELKATVRRFEGSAAPEASRENPITIYFDDYSVDEEEGPVYSADRAWTRCFSSVDITSRQAVLKRGKYGVQLIYKYFSHFAKLPSMEKINEHPWLEIKITQLNTMLNDLYVSC